MPDYYVHPKADFAPQVNIGRGTKIWRNCHIMTGASIGANCILGHNVTIGPGVSIGDGCRLQNNVSVFAGVTLEAYVFCGPGVTFTNVRHPRAFINRQDEYETTRIGIGTTLGAGSVILCGITTGRYVLLGAASFLNTNCNDFSFMAGSPARQLGFVCLCGRVLEQNSLECRDCSRAYRKAEGGLVPDFPLPENPGELRQLTKEAGQ